MLDYISPAHVANFIMKTLTTFDTSEKSSAISSIQVIPEENTVKIVYNSNTEKSYDFYTDKPEYVLEKISKTLENNESIGKLIHQLKKDQVLEIFENE